MMELKLSARSLVCVSIKTNHPDSCCFSSRKYCALSQVFLYLAAISDLHAVPGFPWGILTFSKLFPWISVIEMLGK